MEPCDDVTSSTIDGDHLSFEARTQKLACIALEALGHLGNTIECFGIDEEHLLLDADRWRVRITTCIHCRPTPGLSDWLQRAIAGPLEFRRVRIERNSC